jgi:hypothetical protein
MSSRSSSIATVHRRVVLRRGTLSFPQDLLHSSTPLKSRDQASYQGDHGDRQQ